MKAAESIATGVISLEQQGILVKKPHETEKRKEMYVLTEKGLDLIPILVEPDACNQLCLASHASIAWLTCSGWSFMTVCPALGMMQSVEP